MATPVTIHDQNLPTIALIGRVNVGKSTLFNRLIEENKAIVSDIPGTTRTNNEGIILWRGKQIRIIDTGGLTFKQDVPLESDIIAQTEQAMQKADLIVFVTNARDGLVKEEKELAKRLRSSQMPTFLAVNKIDTNEQANALLTPNWQSLGLGQPFPISGANGRNLGDFLDEIYRRFGSSKRRPKQIAALGIEPIRVSLIGKPNVGKSSLFNKLIGEEKVIVNPLPHTTREPHDTLVTYQYTAGKKNLLQPIIFIDTAGIRRKAKVSGELENIGISKSIEAMEACDIVLLVIDGSENLSSQDLQLGGLLEYRAKSVILLVNKWDLDTDASDKHRNEVKRMIYSYFPHVNFAPILFVSGATGYRVHQILPTIIAVWQARQTTVPVPALEIFIKQATHEHRPSRGKGTRHPEITGMKQIGSSPPVFEIYVKHRTSVHRSYLHFLENKLREQFNFLGTPIIMKLTKLKR